MWHVSAFFFFIAIACVFTISGNEKVLLERVFVMKRAYPQKAYADKLNRKYHIKNDIRSVNFKCVLTKLH